MCHPADLTRARRRLVISEVIIRRRETKALLLNLKRMGDNLSVCESLEGSQSLWSPKEPVQPLCQSWKVHPTPSNAVADIIDYDSDILAIRIKQRRFRRHIIRLINRDRDGGPEMMIFKVFENKYVNNPQQRRPSHRNVIWRSHIYHCCKLKLRICDNNHASQQNRQGAQGGDEGNRWQSDT